MPLVLHSNGAGMNGLQLERKQGACNTRQAGASSDSAGLVSGRPNIWTGRKGDDELLHRLGRTSSSADPGSDILPHELQHASQLEEDTLLRDAMNYALESIALDASKENCTGKDNVSLGTNPPSNGTSEMPLSPLSDTAPLQAATQYQSRLPKWLGLTVSYAAQGLTTGSAMNTCRSLPEDVRGLRWSIPSSHDYQGPGSDSRVSYIDFDAGGRGTKSRLEDTMGRRRVQGKNGEREAGSGR
ncbi:hypothetical protein DAEQUDRAFT_736852 [Daedalea quercina L-15889]|uniref:Uncharacterized protein n=1 Tax=Daedalea quercina L-15889 TaxID=1314783 RepID=A0A165RZR6_9APHY|nr:hypothetical protein DAEQUDRAFT_736852 [Daedalea quercina L-15889]